MGSLKHVCVCVTLTRIMFHFKIPQTGTLLVCTGLCLCFHIPLNFDTDHGIFDVSVLTCIMFHFKIVKTGTPLVHAGVFLVFPCF